MSKRNKNSQKALTSLENRFAPRIVDTHVERTKLTFQGTMASTVGGVIANTIVMDPSADSDWGSYTPIFDEFRVVGIRISLVSSQQYNVAVVNAIGGICFDNDDAASLTAASQVFEYNTAYPIPSVFGHMAPSRENQNICLVYAWMRPTTGAPIPWVDINTPALSTGSVKVYFAGLSASTVYYAVNVEHYVEFRGRR